MMNKIDKTENISKNYFNDNYYNAQKPLVIKGLADNQIAGKKWTLNYFKDKLGGLEIELYDNKNTLSKASAYTSGDLKMKLRDYLSIIETNQPTTLRIFLFNFFKTNPELKLEFPCPHLFKGLLDGKGYMFFGGKDTTVRIHYDIDVSDILLTHFGGQKKVILISPEYSKLLYKLPFNTYSLVNLDTPDLNKYPGLAYIKGYECILEHGDTLYIPSGYWHYITYLESSFSISYRKIAASPSAKLQGLVNILLRLPFDKVMGKILGPKWLKIKEDQAYEKANRDIQRLELQLPEPTIFI